MAFHNKFFLIIGVSLMLACTPMRTKNVKYDSIFLDNESVDIDILHVEEVGQGDPILLIHGFGVSSRSWSHLIPLLSNNNRVITVDLKGFGRSKKPFDLNYSIYDQSMLIYALIKEMKLKNLTIVGHSYGGGVALASVLMSIDSKLDGIKKLVLIDSLAYRQEMPLFIKLLQTPIINKVTVNTIPPKIQVKTIMKLVYYDQDMISDDDIAEYAKPLSQESGRYAIIKVAKQIIPDDIDELSKRYKEIVIPTLVIWGANDAVIPISIGRRISKSINNSTFHILENSGHAPHEEKPDEVSELINKFLFDGR